MTDTHDRHESFDRKKRLCTVAEQLGYRIVHAVDLDPPKLLWGEPTPLGAPVPVCPWCGKLGDVRVEDVAVRWTKPTGVAPASDHVLLWGLDGDGADFEGVGLVCGECGGHVQFDRPTEEEWG